MMDSKRMRSPGYPGVSLRDAIDYINKMFSDVRTSPVDREIAARAMGYGGITGRSSKILSDLGQYGLLEKAGKNEVRVSRGAVEILHPDTSADKARAVLDAVNRPILFQELRERFPDAVPSEAALRSYLLKRGFTDSALPSAIRSYVDSCQYAEQFMEYQRHDAQDSALEESEQVQTLAERPAPRPSAQTTHERIIPPEQSRDDGPQFNMISRSRVILGGSVRSKADAQRVIEFMNAIMALLPQPPKTPEDDQA